ncbi:GNAT family N-acetyltransferase [Aeromonas diversa]|uniref:N-acetyltransferase domain-containing protein n=1 Tax=Aeromonas diversa CDC 2478-85 TaxID=1268237 RepID=N9VE43_9GAMM|nr:GNAT family N-acetyltransferase [Aeromonas diversa]ENY73527.1 hypothetical protein G114_02149 [Aeromonas diversa CDC 2478-85]
MNEIVHQQDQRQFICIVDGQESRLRYRRIDGQTVEAFNTFVPPEARSAGVADQLARAFYNWTQSEGLKIVPTCSYIEVWLSRYAKQ